jgi:hypothetical protein
VTVERRLVWYAAYGSNLDGSRLARYLAEARDTTAPRRDGASTIDHALIFGAHSEHWGGGVAFLDAAAGSGQARVRLWMLGLDQLADVYAQENRHPVGSAAIDPDCLDHGVPDGRYRRLLSLGDHHDTPVITFTAPEPPEPAAPSRAYLAHLVAGLRASHRLDDDGLATYLLAAPGMSAAWSASSLAAMLAGTPRS